MKNGSIATEGATSNGLKGVVLMSINVYMLDLGANNEHNMAKELKIILIMGTRTLCI